MMRKVFFALLVGGILISGLAFAAQQKHVDTRDAGDVTATRKMEQATHSIGSGEVSRLSSGRTAWFGPSVKAKRDTTIVLLDVESGLFDQVMTSAEWDTVDDTDIGSIWNVSTFRPASGDSAWRCGDPNAGTLGGYLDSWYQELTSPTITLPAGADSIYLTYNHWVRTEEQPGEAFSWDGYNVRLATPSKDTVFSEIKPWQGDGSYYRGTAYHEYDSLYAWKIHNGVGGGYSQDTSSGHTSKTYNLTSYAGDDIQIQFVFGSDGAYSTGDDDSLFGAIVDDILVTGYYPDKGTLILFSEDCETPPTQMIPPPPAIPTGNFWHISTVQAHSPTHMAYCADSSLSPDQYVRNIINSLVSPKIARTDLDTALADLKLNFYTRGIWGEGGDILDDQMSNLYSVDSKPFRYISTLHGESNFIIWTFDQDDQWYEFQNPAVGGSGDLWDLTPLLADTTWDTLQVAIQTYSDSDAVPSDRVGLKVDDVTLSGRVGFPWDLGVTALKIPSPNGNDVALSVPSVGIYNYGLNPVGGGGPAYLVYMTILDSLGGTVFPRTQVVSAHPLIEQFSMVEVPLDPTAATFTLTEVGTYFFVLETAMGGGYTDGDPLNDTLKVEDTDLPGVFYYPQVENYPAGAGVLRYHDQGWYLAPRSGQTYTYIREMAANEIAAIRYTPDSTFYPFDLGRAFLYLTAVDVAKNYELKFYGPGTNSPGALWLTIPFQVPADPDTSIHTISVVLDTFPQLQNLSSEFWMGVRFPTATGYGTMAWEPNDPVAGAYWDRSYKYTWRPPPLGPYWAKFTDGDWIMEPLIRFQTLNCEDITVKKASDDNNDLFLDWGDVSQAKFLIYRSTDAFGTYPLHDSTGVDTSHYTDVNAVGNLATNYYYMLRTLHEDGGLYGKDTPCAVGEFDKALSEVK